MSRATGNALPNKDHTVQYMSIAHVMQLTFTAGFGGGATSALVMMRPDEAPINMFSSKIDLMWTVIWWMCNYFPYNVFGRIARLPPVLEICKLLLVVGSGGVMCTRVDQVLKLYPSSTIAALIVGALLAADLYWPCPEAIQQPEARRSCLIRTYIPAHTSALTQTPALLSRHNRRLRRQDHQRHDPWRVRPDPSASLSFPAFGISRQRLLAADRQAPPLAPTCVPLHQSLHPRMVGPPALRAAHSIPSVQRDRALLVKQP